VAGCTGSSGHPATTAATRSAPSGANSSCLLPPASSCYAPRQFRVAYGIQPLLHSGIDGRGETVTVLAPPPAANEPGASDAVTAPAHLAPPAQERGTAAQLLVFRHCWAYSAIASGSRLASPDTSPAQRFAHIFTMNYAHFLDD
jgi:hypothetical protein